jgi:hypothetical protein
MSPKNAEKVRQPVLFIWSVSIICLNQTNQIDQMNQRDQMDQTDRACPRRADHRSSPVPKWLFRGLLGPVETELARVQQRPSQF